jgi:DNA-directed RNA polymerase specialized sigma24 family protein
VGEKADATEVWLPVIGKALAYLCLQEAQRKEPAKFDTVSKRVTFLEGLGLSLSEAAEAAGTSADSVRVLRRRARAGGKKRAKDRKK